MSEQSLLAQFRDHVAEDLRLLALLQAGEVNAAQLAALKADEFPDGLGLRLESRQGRDAAQLMRRALQDLPEAPDSDTLDELAADYAAIYLNHRYHASPCESVWFDDENLSYQHSMFQVREWYKQYGLEAENWRKRPDDHLTLQLEFLAHLFSLDQEVDTLREISRFLDEHLLRWVDRFASRVASRCLTPYHAGLTLYCAAYLNELRDLLAEFLDQPRPDPESVEARMAPKREAVETPLNYVPGMAPSW